MFMKQNGQENGGKNGVGSSVPDGSVEARILNGQARKIAATRVTTSSAGRNSLGGEARDSTVNRIEHPHGHFNEDGTEFIVTNPDAARAMDNFLWNDACFSIVQHTGVGCFDYQPGDKEAIQLLTGIGRT